MLAAYLFNYLIAGLAGSLVKLGDHVPRNHSYYTASRHDGKDADVVPRTAAHDLFLWRYRMKGARRSFHTEHVKLPRECLY